MSKSVWTPRMWQRAQDMRRDRMSTAQIAEVLGLDVKQVAVKFYNQGYRSSGTRTTGNATNNRASPEAMAEREARTAAASRRSQTAEFFGDPPPGFSALDRKRSGTSP